MKKITIKNLKKKGFTLIELLITIAGMSLLASVAYMLYNVSNDDKNSDTEFKRLSQVMKEINDTTATTGIPPGINKTNLYTISNGLESTFSLNTVSSPNPQVLNFEYVNMNSKVCSNFTANMVNSADYVSAIINGSVVKNRDTVNSIISKCGLPNNEVTIVLNKYIDTQVISSVTPNINVSPVTPGVYNPPYVAPPVMPSTFTPPAPLTPFVPPVTPLPPVVVPPPPPVVVPPPPPVVVPPPPPYVPPPPPVGVPPPPPVSVPPPPPPPPPAVPNIPVNNSGSTVVESDDFDYYVTRVCVDGAKLGGGTISGCANLSSPVIYTFVKTGVDLNNISIGYLTEKFPSYSNNYSLETSGRSAISCNEHGSTFSYMFNGIFSDYRDAGNSLSLKSLKAAAAAANGTLYGAALCGHISGF